MLWAVAFTTVGWGWGARMDGDAIQSDALDQGAGATPMTLSPGTRLGPYEIVALIGAGGMGEVYKASDTRLNRTVAIKVLPPHWADDPAMRARFDTEAHSIASLTHPNICTLHDIGREEVSVSQTSEAGTVRAIDYLVMEHLDGKTLAQRLERGPLPLAEALEVSIAVVDALDKAHRAGIVHRDLKPANIMLTPSGPKLLDFGLAKLKALERRGSNPPSSRVPDSVSPGRSHVTSPGMIVGTLQYMAPEQIEGVEADARTDIFAFGAILYEMVTGAKAFEGKNRALLIAAIATLELEPLSKAQPAVSAALDHVARRCLEKDPDDRWQTAHDLAIQLRWAAEGGVAAVQSPVSRDERGRRTSLLTAAALVLAAVVAVPALLYMRGSPAENAIQFRVPVAGLSDADIALSPDGQTIALVARPDTQGSAALFVRPVGSTTFRRLGGTDDASLPFWSPDSRTICFVAGGRLKRVDAAGGAPKDLGEAPGFAGGAWNRDGTILFGSATGLYRVSAEGGTPAAITSVETPETGHFWPSFLPDDRRYVYLAWSAETDSRAVFVGSLDSKDRSKVMTAASNAVYARATGAAQPAAGYLVFHRENTLFGQPFDPDSLALVGDPVHIADQLAFNAATGRGSFDLSQNGVLLYTQGGGATGAAGRARVNPDWQFGWRDRKGTVLGLIGDSGLHGDMDLSPDETQVAVTRQESAAGTADIWVIDWQRASVATRLTLDPSDDMNPVWSSEGDRIAFTTFRNGNADVYVKNANGVGAETPLLNSPNDEFVEDWSRDGKYLAYKLGEGAFEDLYVLPLAGDSKEPVRVVTGPFRKDEPQFSYDGKWLAYISDESGRFEVYVVPFPALDQKVKVTNSGAGRPRWRQDGKELFYTLLTGGSMAVSFTAGAKAQVGIPQPLYTMTNADPVRHLWDVSADGQRFLMRIQGVAAGQGSATMVPFNVAPSNPGGALPSQNFVSSGLTVVLNWESKK